MQRTDVHVDVTPECHLIMIALVGMLADDKLLERHIGTCIGGVIEIGDTLWLTQLDDVGADTRHGAPRWCALHYVKVGKGVISLDDVYAQVIDHDITEAYLAGYKRQEVDAALDIPGLEEHIAIGGEFLTQCIGDTLEGVTLDSQRIERKPEAREGAPDGEINVLHLDLGIKIFVSLLIDDACQTVGCQCPCRYA